MTAPTVTVLMAVHNGERHLRESVESILGQTYDAFELLVIDDASTDGSPTILESFEDPRLRVLVNERNLGLTASLNRGLRETSGRFVARQDADDVSEPSRLERQVAVLEARPDVALVASHHRRIDEDGRHLGVRLVPTESLETCWRLLFLNAFAHSSVTFRRDLAEALGGYDERYEYAQDYDLWSRLARRHPVVAVPEVLVAYRRGSATLTATFEGAGDEVRQIASENIQALGVDPAAVDRDAAWQLLFGSTRDVEATRAIAASRSIMRVHAAFVRSLSLDRRTARGHRAVVARKVGRALLRMGLQRRAVPALIRGSGLLLRGYVLR